MIIFVYFGLSLLNESAKLSAATLAISKLYLGRFCCFVESFFMVSCAITGLVFSGIVLKVEKSVISFGRQLTLREVYYNNISYK